MFTGIVEELGSVIDLKTGTHSAQLSIQAKKVLENTQVGDSIAVNGVCLTVIHKTANEFTVDVMAETIAKTSLAKLKRGNKVNLERALQMQTRLGGHLVSGHVDGVGSIQTIKPYGIAHIYEFNAPPSLIPYILPKGSIAIDGISLTVIDVDEQSFSVSLIPHTSQETTLGFKGSGDTVNLETDLIGKYVARFLKYSTHLEKKEMTLDFLAANGFI